MLNIFNSVFNHTAFFLGCEVSLQSEIMFLQIAFN